MTPKTDSVAVQIVLNPFVLAVCALMLRIVLSGPPGRRPLDEDMTDDC